LNCSFRRAFVHITYIIRVLRISYQGDNKRPVRQCRYVTLFMCLCSTVTVEPTTF